MSLLIFGMMGSVNPDTPGLDTKLRTITLQRFRSELRKEGYRLHMGGNENKPHYGLSLLDAFSDFLVEAHEERETCFRTFCHRTIEYIEQQKATQHDGGNLAG